MEIKFDNFVGVDWDSCNIFFVIGVISWIVWWWESFNVCCKVFFIIVWNVLKWNVVCVILLNGLRFYV